MTAQLTVFHALMTVRIYQKLYAHLAVMATEDKRKFVLSLIDNATYLKLEDKDERFKHSLKLTPDSLNPAFLYWLAQQSCVQDYLSSVFYLVKEKRLVNISRSDLNSIAKQSADSSLKLERTFKNIEFNTGILIEEALAGLLGADLEEIKEELIEQISFYIMAKRQYSKWFFLPNSGKCILVIASISTASSQYLFPVILSKSVLEKIINDYHKKHPEILVYQKTKEDEFFERCFEVEKLTARDSLNKYYRDFDEEMVKFPVLNRELIRIAKGTPQA